MIFSSFNDFIKQLNTKNTFKVCCLDVGEKKIGIATALSSLSLINPGPTFKRLSINEDVKFLKNFFSENAIDGIVIGLPLQMNGIEGSQCKAIRKYIELLDEHLNLPFFFQDERLTTSFATKLTKGAGLNRKKGSHFDDSIAALLTLESFMKKLIN